MRWARSDGDIMCRSRAGKHSVGSDERWWVEIDMQTSKDFVKLFWATGQNCEWFNTSLSSSLSHERWLFHYDEAFIFL